MLYKNHQVKWVDGKCPPIEHLSVHIKIRLISKINRCTWRPVYPVSVTGFRPSSHALFKSYLKWFTSSSLFIHFGRPLLTNTCMWHLLLHSDDITVFCPSNVERQREVVGLWVVPLRSLHCLNTVLHQLMDSIFVDHEGWTKLSSLHQLFETLKVENDTFRTDYFRWTAGTEQTLEFPFHTVGLASLPLPHRTPVVRSHI